MKYRDFLQKLIYVVINPVVKGLIRIGVTPNIVSFTGFLVNMVAAWLFVEAAGVDGTYGHFTVAGLVLLFGSLFDMLDGQVARLGNMQSRFGAMFDSILDRYSEMLTLLAVAYFFFAKGAEVWGLVTFLAMLGSVMVSYVRARAEGEGLECKVGLLQRPERCVILIVAALLTGLLEEVAVMQWAMAIIAVLANLTAFWRIIYCKKQIEKENA